MDVWNHVGFSKIVDRQLWEYVQTHNIPVNHKAEEHIASIEMYASDPHWPWVEAYMQTTKRGWVSDTVFTKEEIQQAQWMRVRSEWVTGYPQPMEGFAYKSITYSDDDFCDECGIGLVQNDSFRMKKAPAWGRRHFFSLLWVEDELFVSEAVRKAFSDDGITGVEFMPVKDRNGKATFDGLFQLQIQKTLEEGLVLEPTNICSTAVCSRCGHRKSRGNEGIMLQFRRQIFENAPDIVKTGDYFGVAGNKAPAREIVISQKVYQCIVKNRLEKNLMFYPIDLV